MMTPLTRSQELFWTGQAFAGEVPLYNQAWRFDLRGTLDPDQFAAAFDQLVSRADVLRTVFSETTTEGVTQRVLDARPVALEQVDLSSSKSAEADADAWIDERSRRPFDLGRATYDAALLKLSDERWVFFFSQHHIVTDAWAVSVLFEALSDHLEALRADKPMPSEPLPPFRDFVAEENAFRASDDGQAASEHWRGIADASAGPVRLYGRRNSKADPAIVRTIRPLTEAQVEGLSSLCQAPGVRSLSIHLTQYNLFATAFLAYIFRVSGQQQITIGSPAHNRSALVHRKIAGLFTEVFPFASALEEDETFRSLFRKVATTTMENMRFAQAGAASVQSGRAFNLVLNYINVAFPEIEGLSRRIEWLSTGAMDPGHDMRLHVMDMNGDGRPVLAFDLNIGTFPESLRHVIPNHFVAILDAMLADFDQPVSHVAMASPAEQVACLQTFNQVPSAKGIGETALSLFERQVTSSRDATAVRFGGTSLSYGDLDQWSDAIAADLTSKGVGPGAPIAIHMTRSPAYVASVLGVMKAGGAFIPLDSQMPLARLSFILKDAGAAAVLTEPSLEGRLPDLPEPVLVIDGSRQGANAPTTRPAIHPDETAYIIYTSGSTGMPKGVAVGHEAFASYLAWACEVYAGNEPASMPLFTAIGFDLTLTSLFVPLISGGTVVVYPEPETGSDISILDVFNEDAVDIVKLTPAHLALVVEHASSSERIRTLILGGEDLKTRLALSALDHLGDHIAIYNEYGPTEAVVGCMVHRFDPETDRNLSVPIGVPAAGMRIYVLDEGLNPLPAGVAGEIFIGGNRLAEGYVGREALPAERFIDDPFVQGGRLYRTGDLARFNDRNQLDYLGRADRQVKLRGVRVELGEIEQALCTLPGVREAVVVAKPIMSVAKQADEVYCTRCGLSSAYPEASIDETGVCSICLDLETYRDRADVYFRDMPELRAILDEARSHARGDYDAIVLTSGGKDSIYALARLADMGPRLLALTLDNGYLSEGAKENIRRVTKALGVDHRYVSTPAMNAIFVDSLERHANVCNGCFKTIYTLAVQTAIEVGAPIIITGLSRGQFFETRLTPDLFKSGPVTCGAIDAMVTEARKAYHRTDDAVSALLDVDVFQDDAVFDQIKFVDFYRYCDVPLDELYRYLYQRLPWKRPDDTGRSSNCLINDVGIYVHKKKEGFHNYALPYSWDVRMGHKDRDAALEELNDSIDVARVRRILDEIGYDAGDLFGASSDRQLIAYVVSDREILPADARAGLRDHLPPEMIPTRFVGLEAIPLTANGKIDHAALPDPDVGSFAASTIYRAPSSENEIILVAIWSELLRAGRIGVDDNFYDLGGDSITAIRMSARARKAGIDLPPALIFQHQTVAELAHVVSTEASRALDQPDDDDLAPFDLAGLGGDDLATIAAALDTPSKMGT